ncbi:MADS box transcription factor [Handroanthus impetiginosus]|uniref:MADS box transcription factor n=1 Tax=Handroanthus impetiginosus TaxID=429701 RepID=A0A2G9HM50_9LAMI|nr:MADS box transcription factor [Handroanthus impetiginosus]
MGRAKLNMELIPKEKSRNITFKKRKEGLIRKMHEFTTLCDVSACMIIYGPKQEKGPVEPDVWPQNLDEIHRIIDIYKSRNKDSSNKTFGLSDFFHDRKRKIEEELAKLKKKNMEAKYPTWLEYMNFLTESQLRDFAAKLTNKAEYVKSRIDFLTRNKDQGLNMNLVDFSHARLSQSHSTFYSPAVMGGIELEVINQQAISSLKPIEMHVPIRYPTTIDHHHQELHSLNQNSMMMVLMNDHNDQCVQLGGASTSGNISFKRQVFYESTSAGRGVVDPMISQRPLARYYAPPVPVPCSVMPGVAPPQLQFSVGDGGQDDGGQYQMNHRARYYD